MIEKALNWLLLPLLLLDSGHILLTSAAAAVAAAAIKEGKEREFIAGGMNVDKDLVEANSFYFSPLVIE